MAASAILSRSHSVAGRDGQADMENMDAPISVIGKITNNEELIERFFTEINGHFDAKTGGEINTTELVAALINQKGCFVEGIQHVQNLINGAAGILIIKDDGSIDDEAIKQVDTLLKQSFRPEFLNRLDEIVYYKPLMKNQIYNIIDLMIEDLQKRGKVSGTLIEKMKDKKDLL